MISTQIHSWLRPVLMTWTMKAAWTRSDRMRNNILYLSGLGPRRCAGGEREGDQVVAARRAEAAVAAGADDEIRVLVASGAIGHGRGLPPRWQLSLSHLASGLNDEGAPVSGHTRSLDNH